MARTGKTLSRNDRQLWGRVAKTVKPLPGRMDALLASSAAVDVNKSEQTEPDTAGRAADQRPQLTQAMREALRGAFSDDKPTREPRRNGPVPSAALHQAGIDKPVHRKIAKGRLPIDGRIDLHGMTLDQAHGVLLAFLARAHAGGKRHVLVITGKGASLGSEGALKRSVPQWLAKPEFAGFVSGYEWAARHHGGGGALYIRLSKRPGSVA
jgi:DNA-nicking Smr family endonuclease